MVFCRATAFGPNLASSPLPLPDDPAEQARAWYAHRGYRYSDRMRYQPQRVPVTAASRWDQVVDSASRPCRCIHPHENAEETYEPSL